MKTKLSGLSRRNKLTDYPKNFTFIKRDLDSESREMREVTYNYKEEEDNDGESPATNTAAKSTTAKHVILNGVAFRSKCSAQFIQQGQHFVESIAFDIS